MKMQTREARSGFARSVKDHRMKVQSHAMFLSLLCAERRPSSRQLGTWDGRRPPEWTDLGAGRARPLSPLALQNESFSHCTRLAVG